MPPCPAYQSCNFKSGAREDLPVEVAGYQDRRCREEPSSQKERQVLLFSGMACSTVIPILETGTGLQNCQGVSWFLNKQLDPKLSGRSIINGTSVPGADLPWSARELRTHRPLGSRVRLRLRLGVSKGTCAPPWDGGGPKASGQYGASGGGSLLPASETLPVSPGVQWRHSACCNHCPDTPGSSDSPVSVSQVAGITGSCHHARLVFVILSETGFHQVGQAVLQEQLTSSDPTALASQSAEITGVSDCTRPGPCLLCRPHCAAGPQKQG
uniref:Uncharacterized protein n=1 Tax=Piliocolobus tephrosceles TaxID=591936 RepID=A0A8C9H2E5_9PRIM